MAVMIGVDPHKASHTAVAIDRAEQVLGELRVRSSGDQCQRLMSWAARWPERSWAIEGAGGLGYLLAQQLVAAGETVLDVQPKLGSRVRLLATGNVNKNDPNVLARGPIAGKLRKNAPYGAICTRPWLGPQTSTVRTGAQPHPLLPREGLAVRRVQRGRDHRWPDGRPAGAALPEDAQAALVADVENWTGLKYCVTWSSDKPGWWTADLQRLDE